MSLTTALVLIAQGSEEIEFVATYDTLVRAGIKTTSALVGSAALVKCSRGVSIAPDTELDKIGDLLAFDGLVIPGGMPGAKTISTNAAVQKLVRDYINNGKVVGMICAGPLAALTSGLPRQPITSHPSVQSQLDQHFEYSEENVVVSGRLVTSRGPGTTLAFALKIIELLMGPDKAKQVAAPMMLSFSPTFEE